MNQRVVGLNSRQLDDLNNEISQPRRLDTHPVELRTARSSAASPTASASSEIAPIGVLSSWLMLATVTTGLLDPLSRRLVVGQDEHQALVKGRDLSGQICGGDANAAVDLEVNDAAIAFAPNAADQLSSLEPQLSASYQAKGFWRSPSPRVPRRAGRPPRRRMAVPRAPPPHQPEPLAPRHRRSDSAFPRRPKATHVRTTHFRPTTSATTATQIGSHEDSRVGRSALRPARQRDARRLKRLAYVHSSVNHPHHSV